MREKIAGYVIIALIIILVATVLFSHHLYKNWCTADELVTQQQKAQETRGALHRLKISNWVFKNSERITEATSKQIVDEALKVEHSLLVLAICSAESNFNPTAVSNKGAQGLGQIMYTHWGVELERQKIIRSRKDLFGIKENIMATSFIINTLMAQSDGDVIKALKAYLGESHYKYNSKVFTAYVSLSALGD